MHLKLFGPVLSLAALSVSSAWSHHSFATYERDRTLTLSGTVKEYGWTSPHVTIRVVTESAGKGLVTWWIEGSSPNVLARGGWTSQLLKPGDKISLGVHPRKDGVAGGLLADEQQVLVNGQPAMGVLWLFPPGEQIFGR